MPSANRPNAIPVEGKCLYAPVKGKIVRFDSMREAARWLGGKERETVLVQQIRACLTGKQKIAHMIKWSRAK